VNKKPLIVILIISVIINLVAIFTFGFFWREQLRHHPGPSPLPPPAAGDHKARLNDLKARFSLSAVQMDTIKVLDSVMRTTMRPVQDTLSAKQEELLSLLKGRTLDQARVDKLSREVVSLRATSETRSLGILMRLRNALTPEQRDQLGELFMAFRAPGPQSGPKTGSMYPGGRPTPNDQRPGPEGPPPERQGRGIRP
jgi:Spy/CpxP family protein refolding chaperone